MCVSLNDIWMEASAKLISSREPDLFCNKAARRIRRIFSAVRIRSYITSPQAWWDLPCIGRQLPYQVAPDYQHANSKFHFAVDLIGAPNHVVYVPPPQPVHNNEEGGGLSSSAIGGIVIGSCLLFLLVVGLVWRYTSSKLADSATAGSEVKHAAGEQDGML
jgi:hypothetical protein